ncbi:MAG: phosphoribosylformylglycinamidine synthase subunit PurQ [candidate division Zixibacteria bacterium]|nr:phosphoribosylformylglycinamidine synthase subunit PurQ [candidate division Zixibacteria bacterium]NIR63847.1 phosphoribosylformylglycinamidine synthase subunit PurQ [candidate division Zixibacteria bacterium]NIS14966.1 phosphoribosylformylglycinamidine synthase subunit PurQ [candidate division Zixibacteria bacterium]NIS45803.1 phosphoribosylformylglycinamidine synthase subunit PurQ [candidate division Zixibacteria bacterium]NIT51492.1 phosphoribosylformylglycinamidine synthase subunit PurQ 
MKFGVVTFPGSNCDYDTYAAARYILNEEVEFLWHLDTDLKGSDVVILPGGFSYGDYLRTGAIARFSPIVKEVIKFAREGGTVWGICNGFQILLEAGLLPGAMLRNKGLRFICKHVHIRVESISNRLTAGLDLEQVLYIPIAHSDGNYYDYPERIEELKKHDQIVFRYCDARGNITPESNPNGSVENIAGICNREKNVFGMMPHPERAVENVLNSSDGLKLFESIRAYYSRRAAV